MGQGAAGHAGAAAAAATATDAEPASVSASRRRAAAAMRMGPVLRECLVVLRRVMAEADVVHFLYPVDPTVPGLERYGEVVPEPMDLLTVKERLETGYYNEDADPADYVVPTAAAAAAAAASEPEPAPAVKLQGRVRGQDADDDADVAMAGPAPFTGARGSSRSSPSRARRTMGSKCTRPSGRTGPSPTRSRHIHQVLA